MRWGEIFKSKFKGMVDSVNRFPLTVLFLIAVTILNALMIENRQMDFTRFIYSFLVGAMLSVVAQMLYERFYLEKKVRSGLMVGSLLITIGYYFAVGPQYDLDIAISIKTFVALFALLMGFIWIPTVNSQSVSFHRNFLVTLKSFFVTLLFSVVLAAGIGAIYSATDYLLFDVNPDVLSHLLNIVVSFFAPIYFLSLTPFFPGKKDERISIQLQGEGIAKIENQFRLPRFFEILLSYVVIPLIAVYTLILVVYILMNITGDFWTDSLLEPLLVSYAISVIIVLILSYNIDNRFAVLFRKIFPKILVPIAVFQTIASIFKIREMGITHGRYYVILFGIFAIIAGLILSFMKPKYHGYIVAVLLVFVTLSIVPPIDAFTISKRNQLSLFETKLTENNLLVDGKVKPNQTVSVNDRIIITNTATYINNMGYNTELPFLPAKFNLYKDFNQTFGFNLTYSQTEGSQTMGNFIYLNRDELVVEMAESDVMILPMLTYMDNLDQEPVDDITFTVDNEAYQLEQTVEDRYYVLTVTDASRKEVISYSLEQVFDKIFSDNTNLPFYENRYLNAEEATFSIENEQIELRLLVLSMEQTEDYNAIEFMMFINIK